jgi:2-hydroxy-6-oxonona-2,4-dienedioate hydrolase
MAYGTMNQPGEIDPVAALDAASRKILTPCGDGTMVWRCWGDGPPVVLLHGGYGSWTHWIRNIAALAERRSVLAPDLPGLGESAMPPEPYTAESLAAIVATGLEIVAADRPPPALIGFSFGAILGGHVAAHPDARIASLTLIGAGGFGPPQPPMSDLKRTRPGMTEAELAQLQKDNLAVLMFADPARVDDLAIRLQIGNTARARIRSRPIAWTDTLRRVLPRITAPVDAIWGAHDVTALPYLAERIAMLRAAQPEADVEILPDVGHWVLYEAADRFNALLGARF